MEYAICKKLESSVSFEQAIGMVTKALKDKGFGILTEIDIKSTFKQKLDVDVMDYKILGACNPNYAYKALQAESSLGVFLPCNVVVEQKKDGSILIAAMDPVVAMMSVENEAVKAFASEVKEILEQVISKLA